MSENLDLEKYITSETEDKRVDTDEIVYGEVNGTAYLMYNDKKYDEKWYIRTFIMADDEIVYENDERISEEKALDILEKTGWSYIEG